MQVLYTWVICHGIKRKGKFMHSNSSGVSHSDGSCVLGRIHSDVSSNISKKVYHIVTDNFVNLLHISYAWLYKTECWGRKFHAFSFNSHRNCKIFMTNLNFIFDTICVPYIFRNSIFGWNCDHHTPLCDTPLLEDTPLCDTPDELHKIIFCKSIPYFIPFSNRQYAIVFNWGLQMKSERKPVLVNMLKSTSHDSIFQFSLFSTLADICAV